MKEPLVSIVMGSLSDLEVMDAAAVFLRRLDIPYEMDIVSAHRTPQRLFDYAAQAVSRNLRVIIAGAGGAAHLPGMIASITPLPVIGVPIKSSNSLEGWDSILSILQMPNGVPVATVALNGALNAAVLACQILGTSMPEVLQKVEQYKASLSEAVEKSASDLRQKAQ